MLLNGMRQVNAVDADDCTIPPPPSKKEASCPAVCTAQLCTTHNQNKSTKLQDRMRKVNRSNK